MAIYQIPVSHFENLEKKINRIRNKGANITFEVIKESIMEHELKSGAVITLKCYDIEVEGKYQIADWRFVGTIEHGEKRNIMRIFDSSLANKIPEKYKTAGRECEHCHQVRDRKDTYLVYNEKTNEFKQVGKTCLMGYTNGLDAENCAFFASFIRELETEEEKANELFRAEFAPSGNAYSLSTESIKPIIFGYVKAFGYVPKETVNVLIKILFVNKRDENFQDATDTEIKEMNEWAETVNTRNEYMWNATTAWTKSKSEYRDIALLASFVQVYLKQKAENVKKTQTSADYVGNVNDKITIDNIKSVRVLYVKDGRRYAYNAPSVYVYEIVDGAGHVYIWSTGNGADRDESTGQIKDLVQNTTDIDTIVATVKEHKEYRGVKQTVITRGKVNWKKSQSKKSEPVINKGHEGFKSFFSYLDDIDD